MPYQRRLAYFVIVLVSGFGLSASGNDREIERLIDQLVDVSEPGFGYSPFISGDEFLPYQGTGEVGTMILGGPRPARSDVLRKMVEQGADAVPMLLKHIGDNRRCKMEPVSGFMWMDFSDEFDFNPRTTENAPAGVNLRRREFAENQPDKHSVTVGDLCFVALGQIVNRSFEAVRYQPSGGAVINSPTYSAALRRAVLREWNGLTKDDHRRRLAEDFTKADNENRRIGGYLRLAFYYPAEVETLVLEELAKPTYDVFAVHHLCREVLYKTTDKAERRRKFDEFVSQNGELASAGVMDYLFEDLDTLEANEEGRIHPPVTWFANQPRELLIELFGKPKSVKAADRPVVRPTDAAERARLIRALTHDRSVKIAEAVIKIFGENKEDDYFASACLRCLANRDQGAFLIEQLRQIGVSNAETNQSQLNRLDAIATSNDPRVRDVLWEIAQATSNVNYFVAMLPAVDRKHGPEVFSLSKKLLNALPDEATEGERLLRTIRERHPDEAPAVFKDFLSKGSARRIETICRVLWNGDPLAKKLLAPYLDDKRDLAGFAIPMRVCDRTAQAISHSTDGQIKFSTDWSREQMDAQIERLKQYCKER